MTGHEVKCCRDVAKRIPRRVTEVFTQRSLDQSAASGRFRGGERAHLAFSFPARQLVMVELQYAFLCGPSNPSVKKDQPMSAGFVTPSSPARSAGCWSPPRREACVPSAWTMPKASSAISQGGFPGSDPARDDAGLRQWAGAIVRHVDGERQELNVPVNAQATPFQRVWSRAFGKIPYGQTRASREVSKSDWPSAIRA